MLDTSSQPRTSQLRMSQDRMEKLDDVIRRQRDFVHRVQDPDSRQLAEEHLIALVDLRDQLCVDPDHGSAR